MSAPRNPLQPFTGFIRLMWSVTTVLSAVAVLLVAFASYGTSVCFTSELGTELMGTKVRGDVAHVSAESLRICVSRPDGWDRVLGLADLVLPMVSYALLLFLLMRLLERGAVEGVHTVVTADRLRRLGWFALVAVPVATLGEAAAQVRLLSQVLPDADLPLLTGEWDIPWWAVATGLGMLSLAKIMRTSAAMREDLEGTV
ncbi:hypothetical protein [Saccharothrix stipae]